MAGSKSIIEYQTANRFHVSEVRWSKLDEEQRYVWNAIVQARLDWEQMPVVSASRLAQVDINKTPERIMVAAQAEYRSLKRKQDDLQNT